MLNRHTFVRELTRCIAFADRYGMPASVVYFDLDGFNAVNDTHHHAGGDAVLAHFASVLQANVCDSDTIGRLGGRTPTRNRPTGKSLRWRSRRVARPEDPGVVFFRRVRAQARRKRGHRHGRADEAMYAQKRAR